MRLLLGTRSEDRTLSTLAAFQVSAAQMALRGSRQGASVAGKAVYMKPTCRSVEIICQRATAGRFHPEVGPEDNDDAATRCRPTQLGCGHAWNRCDWSSTAGPLDGRCLYTAQPAVAVCIACLLACDQVSQLPTNTRGYMMPR